MITITLAEHFKVEIDREVIIEMELVHRGFGSASNYRGVMSKVSSENLLEFCFVMLAITIVEESGTAVGQILVRMRAVVEEVEKVTTILFHKFNLLISVHSPIAVEVLAWVCLEFVNTGTGGAFCDEVEDPLLDNSALNVIDRQKISEYLTKYRLRSQNQIFIPHVIDWNLGMKLSLIYK